MRRALYLILAVLCGRAAASGAPPGTLGALVRSGDVASDGLALDAIADPVARSANDVAFVGTTSAILRRQGGTTAVVAKTGDALPAGQTGTFDAVYDPAIDDGGTIVAFAATLNGAAPGGVFRAEGGGIVPVVIGDDLAGDVAVNARGDVVFRQGRSALSLVARGSSAAVRIASLDDAVLGTTHQGRFVGRPVLGNGGAVAFVVDGRNGPGGGVFGWSAGGGIVPLGRVGDASSIPGRTFASTRRQTAAVNAAGEVAFTATLSPGGDTGVFAWNPSSGVTRTVAAVGAVVGGSTLTGVEPEYVGIDPGGRVAFQGRFDTARRLVLAAGSTLTTLGPIDSAATDFLPGLTAGTRIVWTQDGNVEGYVDAGRRILLTPGGVPLGPGFTLAHPAVTDGGVTVCQASRGGLYRLQDGTLRAVVRDGDVVGGVGAVTGIATGFLGHAYRGDALVVLTTDAQGRRVLAVDGAADFVKVAASGDPTPAGGTFNPVSEAAVDVVRRTVVFSSPIALADGSESSALFKVRLGARPIRTLVKAGEAAPGGGAFDVVSLLGGGRTPVFRAVLADGRSGLFALRGGRTSAITRTGDPAPGGGVFGDFRLIAVDAGRVFFTALIGPGDDAPQGLFRWQRGRLRKVAAAGDPSPAGGTFSAFGGIDIAGRRVVFGASIVERAQTRMGVFRGRPGRIETIALAGDPLAGGATLSLDGLGRVVAAGPSIGFVGAQSETTSEIRSGLFEARRGQVRAIALAGQPTPIGGTYAGFADESVAPADGAVVFVASIDGVAEARAGLFAFGRGRPR